MKEVTEWTIDVVGLKIAMLSWGSRGAPGVLLLHGHGDSAATFAPLLALLPGGFHYVGFDFPGHGKSDFLPAGPLPTHSLFLEVIRKVLQHLEWETFMCISHSMGGALAILFHRLRPGLTRLVCLDPLYGLLRYSGMTEHHSKFVSLMFYERYYDTLYRNFSEPKISTYEEALESVMRTRKLTRERAELILSRNLTPAGEGLYKLSPQKAAFQTAHIPVTFDLLEQILSDVSLPLLIFHTTQALSLYNQIQCSSQSVCLFDHSTRKYKVVCVDGSHDHHLLKPEDFVDHIVDFLNTCSSKI